MSLPSMTPQLFAILTGLVEEKAGLHYGLEDREIFADKVWARAQEAGFESLLDYYYFLRYDDASGAELQGLIDALVVGETFFFREMDTLEILIQTALEPKVEAGARPRVWCAGCSSGEEPYTLAMLLDDRKLLGHVEVVATDISTRSLHRAREGVAPRRSLRHVPRPELVRRWLKVLDDQVVVEEALRRAVDFRRLNLMDGAAIQALGKFDAIVCRNVLIYFRDETVRAVVEGLTGQLVEGGLLCVGVSESLMRFSAELRCEERQGAFFYRKGGEGGGA
jgi:chemotaxis protein methyltransferase CheR